MKSLLLTVTIAVLFAASGCKKDANVNPNAPSAKWVGVYTAPPFGSSFNELVITRVSDSTVQMDFKIVDFSYLYIATTIKNVHVSDVNQIVSFNDNETIIEHNGIYNIQGTMSLNGTHISLSANAVDSVTGPENNKMSYTFSGDKAQ